MRHLEEFGPAFLELGVELIEQPLPDDRDQDLIGFACPIPLCADESCHDRASLDHLRGKYSMINIKLDKTGGLTEALALRESTEEHTSELQTLMRNSYAAFCLKKKTHHTRQ